MELNVVRLHCSHIELLILSSQRTIALIDFWLRVVDWYRSCYWKSYGSFEKMVRNLSSIVLLCREVQWHVVYAQGDILYRLRMANFIQGGSKKSKLLILAVNDASPTRVSFAKFIPTLVEKMFDMCSIVPNYSLKSLSPFVYTLVDERL